ncbi:hypothetical protein [Streptomyces sp. S1D4-20]|uniref:hypothetical protein n=1 Tax=Streptomyces sp. S1D4-20 TaxID=2594462 RepID=UPI001163EA0D|nr:hypothetical protein [Streptomyces sp. S1D4-20]QDN54223.1 hypothetical protein FNV67_01245 [Streptomyces sp. S1D4-20]
MSRQRTARCGASPVEGPPTTIVCDEGAAVFADVSRPIHDLIADLIRRGRTPGVHVPRQRQLLDRQYPTLGALTAAIDRGEA